jgi:hypothetical protein
MYVMTSTGLVTSSRIASGAFKIAEQRTAVLRHCSQPSMQFGRAAAVER